MTPLLLVRHARTRPVPGTDAATWDLTDAGKASCGPLASVVRPYAPQAIVSSVEPKAVQTATALASLLDARHETADGLHEHDRTGAGAWLDAADFDAAVRTLFDDPDRRGFGRETGREARERFAAAVGAAVEAHAGPLAIVTHGTVMALYVGGYGGYDLWKRLTMPAVLVLDRASRQLEDVHLFP